MYIYNNTFYELLSYYNKCVSIFMIIYTYIILYIYRINIYNAYACVIYICIYYTCL